MAPAPKTVVVLGLGQAGANVINQLLKSTTAEEIEIIAVDSRNFGYVKYAGCRIVAKGESMAAAALIPLDQVIPEGRGKLVRGVVQSVDFSAKKVTLESSELFFDYLVCCTGARNMSPVEPPLEAKTAEDMIKWFGDVHTAVEKAEQIYVVGSGSVGIELAGEIKAEHPKKKVTLITRAKTLLDTSVPSVPNKMVKSLLKTGEGMGINFIFEDEIDFSLHSSKEGFDKGYFAITESFQTKKGVEFPAGLVIKAIGTKVSSEMYPKEFISEVGYLKVDDSFQVIGAKDIFACGDLCDTKESKQGYIAGMHAAVVGKNIALLVKGKDKLGKYSVGKSAGISVPLGPSKGASTFFGWTMGSFMTSNIKGKSLFLPMAWGTYKASKLIIDPQDPKAVEKLMKYENAIV